MQHATPALAHALISSSPEIVMILLSEGADPCVTYHAVSCFQSNYVFFATKCYILYCVRLCKLRCIERCSTRKTRWSDYYAACGTRWRQRLKICRFNSHATRRLADRYGPYAPNRRLASPRRIFFLRCFSLPAEGDAPTRTCAISSSYRLRDCNGARPRRI
jgi:hypothetical protein